MPVLTIATSKYLARHCVLSRFKISCMRTKGAFTRCDKNMRRATQSSCVNGIICGTCDCCMLSQENRSFKTFLPQHATVACRTNKPVYTARFCRMSHVFVASCKLALKLGKSNLTIATRQILSNLPIFSLWKHYDDNFSCRHL